MWQEFSEHEAMQALRKYGVFVLTPHRRHLLGNTLINLEKRNINLQTARMQLRNQILFNKSIIDAMKKASYGEQGEHLFKLNELKTRIKYI